MIAKGEAKAAILYSQSQQEYLPFSTDVQILPFISYDRDIYSHPGMAKRCSKP